MDKSATILIQAYNLRPAVPSDASKIKVLIIKVRINPLKLDWRRFWVADDRSGMLVACGQLKPVPGGLIELSSLAVHASHRHKGLARALIEILLDDTTVPIYLTCRSRLRSLYEKFGFKTLIESEMPVYYLRFQRLVEIFLKCTHPNETLVVMKLG